MVYMGNIQKLHSSLHQNEEIVLTFKSGEVTKIKRSSQLEACNGDLKIVTRLETRASNSTLWKTVIVDCAEIEKISTMRRNDGNEF